MEDKWIKVSERLPKKIDGRIRSNAVLVVNQYGDWSVAEYNFDKKEWIDRDPKICDRVKIFI